MFSDELAQLMDEPLNNAIGQILKDKDYIKENHVYSWTTILPKLNTLLFDILTKIYKADLEYECKNPLNSNFEAIGKFATRLTKRLNLHFQTSPPFTIHHLVATLTFQTPGFQLPPTITATTDDGKGLESSSSTEGKKFKTTIRNMISKEETIVECINKYSQSPDPDAIPTKLNELYAIKYLRSLEGCICVQSSVDEINKDLEEYQSENTTLKTRDAKSTDNDTKFNGDSIQMVKIDWLDEVPESMRGLTSSPSTTLEANKQSEVVTASFDPVEYENGDDDDDNSGSYAEVNGANDTGDGDGDEQSPKRSSVKYNDHERVIKRTKSISNMKEELSNSADDEDKKDDVVSVDDPNNSVGDDSEILTDADSLEVVAASETKGDVEEAASTLNTDATPESEETAEYNMSID
ncbi:hypothetical protein CANARDRAFT_24291 [[Candida] arabinofermentans NRRL YB-2248]|uniref:Uncharacterized protein n=1 Tax=[Candida] arabinofermentans NRRL YB-2248 TaxID=983967 RepID=A0A1E4SXH4_9ASCO|nr:hypothetical protein CANARDRAFT_24291 [[Candida] arabinofermentans NRRL YB-2248]